MTGFAAPLSNSSYVPPPIAVSAVSESKCPFFRLLKRIATFTKNFFASLGKLFKPSPNLPEKDIQRLQERIAALKTARGKKNPFVLQNNKKPFTKPSRLIDALVDTTEKKIDGKGSKLKRRQSESNLKLDPNFSPNTSLKLNSPLEIEVPNSIEDPTMRNLYFESQIITKNVSEATYNEFLDPYIKKVQTGISIAPKILKKVAEAGTIVGFEAFRPLYQMFASVEVKDSIDAETTQSLIWLKTQMPENFQDILERHILENEKNLNLNDLRAYTTPLTKWFRSDFKHPLSSYYSSTIDEARLNVVLKHAIKLLLEHELNLFIKHVDISLGKQLPIIVHGMVHDNFKQISSDLILRTISLLETMNFPRMVDSLVGVVYDQTHAIIEIEDVKTRAAAYVKSEIERYKLASQVSLTAENKKSKEAAEVFLKELKVIGKRVYIQNAVDQAVEKARHEEPKKVNERIEQATQNLNHETVALAEQARELLVVIAKKGLNNFIREEVEAGVEISRQKATLQAEEEIKDAEEVSESNEVQAEFAKNLLLLGEETYIQNEAQRASIGAYQAFSPRQDGVNICHPSIVSQIQTGNLEEKKAFYHEITRQLLEALLPDQPAIIIEERYKAVLALNLNHIIPLFQPLAEIPLYNKNLTEEQNRSNRKSEECLKGQVLGKLYDLCEKECEEAKDLIDEEAENPEVAFRKIILPLIETINIRLHHKAEDKFSKKLDDQDFIDVMKSCLYPQVSLISKTDKQHEIEAKLIDQKNGVVSIDRLALLVNQLTLHKKIKELVKYAKVFAGKIFSENAQGKIKNLLNTCIENFGSNIERNAMVWVKGQLQNQLATLIQENIESLVNAEKLKTDVMSNLFPLVKKMMLRSIGHACLKNNIGIFSKYFEALIKLDKENDKEKRKNIHIQLSNELFELVCTSLKNTSSDLRKMTEAEYQECFEPLLTEVENTILKIASEDGSYEGDVIEKTLGATLNPIPRNESDRRLGTLALNAVSKLGALENIGTASKGAKLLAKFGLDFESMLISMISDLASVGLQDFRESPHLLIDAALPTIKDQFKVALEKRSLDNISEKIKDEINAKKTNDEIDAILPRIKDQLKDILDKRSLDNISEKTKGDSDETLKGEISTISKIAYDILLNKIEELKYSSMVKELIKKGVSLFIGSDTSKLEQSIADIYKKIFGDSLINENFAIKSQEVIFAALTQASEEIAKTTKPIVLSSMPRLIPAFIT